MNNVSPPGEKVEIRALRVKDWQAVSLIYQDGIDTGHATFETDVPSWSVWNKGHLTSPRLVATSAERVVGWAALTPVSARSVYAGVAETSVYVAQECRGKGVGRALLQTMIAEAESGGIWTLQASIFPENAASLKLHKSCEFRVVGTRKRIARLNGVWRDTVLLERRSNLIGND